MRLPGTARAGLLALCAGFLIYGPVYYWVNSRTLVPLDIPVTLAPGHIRSGDFKINVDAYFSIEVAFPFPWSSPECHYPEGLKTRQLSTIGGQPISVSGAPPNATGLAIEGPYLGEFHGVPGVYNLDLEVLSDTKSVDHCQPSLRVTARYDAFAERDSILSFWFFFCSTCVLFGVSLLLVSASTRFTKRSIDELSLNVFHLNTLVESPPPVNPKPQRPIPLLLYLGILGVASGLILFFATTHWYDSRRFVVVDMPVSLGSGHFKPGDFTTPIKGTYLVAIESQQPSVLNPYTYYLPKTHLVLTRDNREMHFVEIAESEWYARLWGARLYSFDAEPASYKLDLEILADASFLNVGNPHLRVYLEDRSRFNELNAKLQLVSFICFTTGLIFLIAHRRSRFSRIPQPLPLAASLPQQRPAWGITGLRHRRFPGRHALSIKPLLNIPQISLVCSFVWLTWFVPMWIMYSAGHVTSKGLHVLLASKKAPPVPLALGLTAPLITIDAKGHVFLNYKPTTWNDLPAELDLALLVLPQRVVYFDADPDILFMDAAYAIDLINAAGAKPILMTPGSKKEDANRQQIARGRKP
jgi:biopolymer transport protein ExbD